MEGLRRRLEATAREAGLDRVGFAGTAAFPEVELTMRKRLDDGLAANLGFTYGDPVVATTPRASFPWAKTLIVGARAYLPEAGSPDIDEDPNVPTGKVARVAVGDRYEPLRAGLEQVGDVLRAEGYLAEVLCDDNRLVDRAAAVRAGVGWWGKNTMILIPGSGPGPSSGRSSRTPSWLSTKRFAAIAGHVHDAFPPAPPELL